MYFRHLSKIFFLLYRLFTSPPISDQNINPGFLILIRRKNEKVFLRLIGSETGLPDGIFSNQKTRFG
jgi:hypothetical protein